MNKIKNRIKELRTEQGITQQELANRTHVSKNTIATYENETRKPCLGALVIMSEIFNASTDYILGKSDIRNQDTEHIVKPEDKEKQETKEDIQPKNTQNFCNWLEMLSFDKNYAPFVSDIFKLLKGKNLSVNDVIEILDVTKDVVKRSTMF